MTVVSPADSPSSARKPGWWQGPLCISDVQLTPDELHELGPEGAAALLSDLGFNVQELAFPALPGYEGSYLRAPWSAEDYHAFVDACHRHDMRVTPYLNVHGFYVELLREHPGWAQRGADGEPTIRGNGVWVPPCFNGPWRDYALDAIQSLVSDYPLDGIFLDGPIFVPGSCYCDHCRARFRDATGAQLPAWEDWDDPAWKPFLQFRRESMAAFLADIRRRLDVTRPGEHLILYMNNASLGTSWPGGRETRTLSPHLDLLGNERANVFNVPPPVSPLWLVGAAVKILETQAQAHGQPTVQYCCFRHLPWDYYGLPAAEYRVHVAGALANGAHPQVMGGLRYLDEPLRNVVRDLNTLQRNHPSVFCGTRSAANLALVWPQRTADFGGVRTPLLPTAQSRIYPPAAPDAPPPAATGAAVAQDEFYGWAEALLRGALPYDVLDDAALEAGAVALERYDAIVLPAAQCLSEAACAALEAYVRAGGHLVATATTSLCDEWDVPRSDFRLAEVFGASYGGRLVGPLPIDYLEISAAARAGEAGRALLAGIEHDTVPAPPSAVHVTPRGGTVLATHLHKLRTRYEPIARDPQPVPAGFVNHYGSGTCVFLPGTFGAAYWHNRFPDYRQLLLNAIQWRCPAQVSLRASRAGEAVPDAVEMSWRRAASGEWLLHLVNHTGTMSRPIERVLPVYDLVIALPALAGRAGNWQARALVAGEELAVEQRDDGPRLRLPALDAYEVIVLREDAAGDGVDHR